MNECTKVQNPRRPRVRESITKRVSLDTRGYVGVRTLVCVACVLLFLVSLGIAATSTQPAGHVHVVGGVCKPRFWCRVSPDHGGMGSLFSTCCRQARAWMPRVLNC